MAVLFVELNHFKGINDSFGHEQGDTGVNGEEGAISVAERIAAELVHPIRLEGGEVVVPASIGSSSLRSECH